MKTDNNNQFENGYNVHNDPSYGLIKASFIKVDHDTHMFNQKAKSGQAVCIEVYRAQKVTLPDGHSKFVPTTLVQKSITTHAELSNLVLNMNGGAIHLTHQVMLDPKASVVKVKQALEQTKETHPKIDHNVLNDYKDKAKVLKQQVEQLLNCSGKKDTREAISKLRELCRNVEEKLPEMSANVATEFERLSAANSEVLEQKTRDKLEQFKQQKRIG